jgi:hypothetical protein
MSIIHAGIPTSRRIAWYAIDVERPAVDVPGLKENLYKLRETRRMLFDRDSRPYFGDVAEQAERGVEVPVLGPPDNRGLLHQLFVVGTFERAARLGEEHIVERRLVELEVLDFDALGVERADDVCERGLAALQANRGAAFGAVDELAEELLWHATRAELAAAEVVVQSVPVPVVEPDVRERRVPFTERPSLGGSETMRGLAAGRRHSAGTDRPPGGGAGERSARPLRAAAVARMERD